MLGGLAVMALSGAGTAAFALNEVHKIVEAFHGSKPIKVPRSVLPPPAAGAPETLLLVGNDERKPTRYNPLNIVPPHSNEMLLVRIDPRKPTISMLSIPRELQVTFTTPRGEVVTNRINSAYTYGYEQGGGTSGGVRLMVETIKHVLGITVNQVFVTNFKKFERAVNEMGCVYMTVDKHYDHTNEAYGEQYSEIHLEPGYQRLCGKEALEYVANRHESTSLIRDARDQRFLLEVKAQYGPKLFEDRERFEHIFGKTVENTLKDEEEEVLQLLQLLVQSAEKPVRQVHFNVNLLPSYDTASQQQIEEAVHSFMTGTAAVRPQHVTSVVHGARAHAQRRQQHRAPPTPPASTSLSPTPSATLREARALGSGLPFAVDAPQYQYVTAESAPDEMRRYTIRGPGRKRYPSYVIVVGQVGLGQYYDIQGSAWADPYLLSGQSQSLTVGKRTYHLYYDSEHMKTIAWEEGGAEYWIENSLTYALSPQQMVAIAEETRPVTGRVLSQAAAGAIERPSGRQVRIPQRPLTTVGSATRLGDYLGFAVSAAVALLLVLIVMRQRELRRLRAEVATAMSLEARARMLARR